MRKKGYGVRDNTEDPKLAPSKGVAKNDKLLRYVQSEHKKGNLNCFVEHLEPKVSRDTSANGETNEWVMQMMEDEASHDMGCAASQGSTSIWKKAKLGVKTETHGVSVETKKARAPTQ
ncbi:hypothetical protein PInf_013155 [Phytophthora infestans]|nr:hypothetical protein PInf_013155 [Phytophthora infestans]